LAHAKRCAPRPSEGSEPARSACGRRVIRPAADFTTSVARRRKHVSGLTGEPGREAYDQLPRDDWRTYETEKAKLQMEPSDKFLCCAELKKAMSFPAPIEQSLFVNESGHLFLTVGRAQTADGPAFFDHVVAFCPFCGTELSSRGKRPRT
jgi:hypothetical protein